VDVGDEAVSVLGAAGALLWDTCGSMWGGCSGAVDARSVV